MEVSDAILKRRSIRKFDNREIPKQTIEIILAAAMKAPSAKNRQPWKFIIVTDKEKQGIIEAMQNGIEKEKIRQGLLPNYPNLIKGAEYSMNIMEQAPVTIFVFNTERGILWNEASVEQKFFDIANLQSIGAAIENMLLKATDLGIGSLWICDIFFAYRELCDYFNSPNELIAAVSLGYADENPKARPRKKFDDIVEWR